MRENSTPKGNSMETECSIILVAKFATLAAGRAMPFMGSEFCIMKFLKIVESKLLIGVSIWPTPTGAIIRESLTWTINRVLGLFT